MTGFHTHIELWLYVRIIKQSPAKISHTIKFVHHKSNHFFERAFAVRSMRLLSTQANLFSFSQYVSEQKISTTQ